MKSRSTLLLMLLFVAVSVCLPCRGIVWSAEKYPTRPVTSIVTFAPGGISDMTMRLWGKYLEKYVGGTFVVDHKPGGGGVIGYTYVALSSSTTSRVEAE